MKASPLQLVEHCQSCHLRSEGFFCQLSSKVLQAFSDIQTPTSYPAGAVLFMEGQPPRGGFMLCRGLVKLTMNSAAGKTVILRIVKPGEILGLAPCIQGVPYDTTAETVQPCQVNFMRRADLLRFLDSHGEATLHAAQELSRGCRAAHATIRALGLGATAHEKVAHLLLDWAETGQETPGGLRLKLTLTQEEIAQLLGLTRETVTRILGEFRRKRIAEFSGSTLWIRDKQSLSRMIPQ